MSTLWLVATPIGNLGDLPPRAIEILGEVALVCCEDTRRTGRLLHHVGIKAERLAVANEHTEHRCVEDVVHVLGDGRDVAVVSDAGTPGVSDPGERLVRAALDAGHDVKSVPGPVAAVTALVVSGLPTDRFVVEGFLPRSGRIRQQRLDQIAGERRTTVLYEAPPRVRRTLDDLAAACGTDRDVAVSRELTKLYEETVRGTLGTIDVGEPRGEYVIVVAGAPDDRSPPTDDEITAALQTELANGSSTRDAVNAVASRLDAPRRAVYSLAIAL